MVIRQLQKICNELEPSLTLASNATTVTPALQRHLDLQYALLRQAHDELDSTLGAASLAEAELAQFYTLYEEYEMNLLRENDAPMSLSLALPPISIPEFNGSTCGGAINSHCQDAGRLPAAPSRPMLDCKWRGENDEGSVTREGSLKQLININ